MRLLLLIAVIALGTDALLHNGSYTQAAWREASVHAGKLLATAQTTARDADQRS